MTPGRPNCTHCGGEVPRSAWSDRDVRAEAEYRRAHPKEEPRPVFCSKGCARAFRDAAEPGLSSARAAALERARAARMSGLPQPVTASQVPALPVGVAAV